MNAALRCRLIVLCESNIIESLNETAKGSMSLTDYWRSVNVSRYLQMVLTGFLLAFDCSGRVAMGLSAPACRGLSWSGQSRDRSDDTSVEKWRGTRNNSQEQKMRRRKCHSRRQRVR